MAYPPLDGIQSFSLCGWFLLTTRLSHGYASQTACVTAKWVYLVRSTHTLLPSSSRRTFSMIGPTIWDLVVFVPPCDGDLHIQHQRVSSARISIQVRPHQNQLSKHLLTLPALLIVADRRTRDRFLFPCPCLPWISRLLLLRPTARVAALSGMACFRFPVWQTPTERTSLGLSLERGELTLS